MKTSPVKHPTILWADDDPDELMLMREVLQAMDSDFQIVEASNGKEALAYLEQAKLTGVFPCLIVLDINMPVLSGRDTLVRLKQDREFEAIPIVVFTTSSSPLDKEFCRHYNTEMLTKPITYAALKQAIQKLLQLCEVSVKER
jgi:CheY-like chemotaxis protein